jgi:hypothetical protein
MIRRREFITLLGGAAATQTGKRHYLTQRSRPCAGERRYRWLQWKPCRGWLLAFARKIAYRDRCDSPKYSPA